MTSCVIWIGINSGTCVRKEVRKGSLRYRTIFNKLAAERAWGRGMATSSTLPAEVKAEHCRNTAAWYLISFHLLPMVTFILLGEWRYSYGPVWGRIEWKKWGFANKMTRSNRKIWKWAFGVRTDELQTRQVSSLLPLKFVFFQVHLKGIKFSYDKYKCGRFKVATNSLLLPISMSGVCFPPSLQRVWPWALLTKRTWQWWCYASPGSEPWKVWQHMFFRTLCHHVTITGEEKIFLLLSS